MTSLIHLGHGPLRCHIAPDMGGCITGFWHQDTAVLRSVPDGVLPSVREAASYPLVPFSNRIGHASLQWNGTSHPLLKNFGDEPHAIHGVGWQRPWQVLECDARFALLSFEHRPDLAWPFAFDASQAFRLTDDALEMTLSITNQSAQAAPVGLGWHPFFVKRATTHIAFEASGRWEMSPEKLPTHRSAVTGLETDASRLDIDHCFDGWQGAVHVRDHLLHCQMRSTLSRLVVFTRPDKDFVAIEPVSHVNNALNLMAAQVMPGEALGVQVLQPGESMSCEMSIAVEVAP